jgi:Domain of unknown function (DUF4440)
LTISFALPVFAQDKGAVDPKIEQQIRAFNEEWDKAFNRNDATAMGTFYTDDAVIISPNEGTFTGRKEIVERKLKLKHLISTRIIAATWSRRSLS